MEELIERIKQKIASNPPLFVSEKGTRPIPMPQPVTEAQLAESEAQLGFRLPELLRQLYLRVGNGGFGPEYGILGITPEGWKIDFNQTALSEYLVYLASPYRTEAGLGKLPVCYYGCAEYIYLDCTSDEGRVLHYSYQKTPGAKAPTLKEWLEEWLGDGSTVYLDEIYYEDDGSMKEDSQIQKSLASYLARNSSNK